MSQRFAGQVALVTGAASGIGRATAVLLARQGATLIVADLDTAGIAGTVAQIESAGGTAIGQRLDVTAEADWEAALAVVGRTGRLGVLVNCAGIALVRTLAETTLAEWRRVQAVNLDGVFLGTRAAVRVMRGTGGSVVNVASASGLKAAPSATAYCTSKAAVIMFTRAAAAECAADGSRVRVNAVAPGAVKTPLWANTPGAESFVETEEWKAGPDAPLNKRFATPEEVAAAIAFLASDEASYITGSVLTVDAGFTA